MRQFREVMLAGISVHHDGEGRGCMLSFLSGKDPGRLPRLTTGPACLDRAYPAPSTALRSRPARTLRASRASDNEGGSMPGASPLPE